MKQKNELKEPKIELKSDLKTDVELLKCQMDSLKSEARMHPFTFPLDMSSERTGFRNPPVTTYMNPHISYSLFPENKIVNIRGVSFSTPNLISNPPMNHWANVFVQFRHINSPWHSYPDSLTPVRIDVNGNINLDISYDGKGSTYSFAIKIIAFDLYTNKSSNTIIIPFHGDDGSGVA